MRAAQDRGDDAATQRAQTAQSSSSSPFPFPFLEGTPLNFLEALFSGAKALVRQIVGVVRSVVRDVLGEVGRSASDRAALPADGAVDRFFKQAQELAEVERELAAKAQRDRKRTETDVQRLRQLAIERERVRAEMERANAQASAKQLLERADDTLLARLDDDELSSNVGILAAKDCPSCGGAMRIRQGAVASDSGQRRFYWQCTEPRQPPCPSVKLDPNKHDAGVLRLADEDLDTPKAQRHAVWNRSDILAQTHGRVRQHLGDADQQVVCPQHLLPMKLLPKRAQGGRVLDSYEYVCLGVTADGKACEHRIELQTMPQVAAMLRRTEGEGIIGARSRPRATPRADLRRPAPGGAGPGAASSEAKASGLQPAAGREDPPPHAAAKQPQDRPDAQAATHAEPGAAEEAAAKAADPVAQLVE